MSNEKALLDLFLTEVSIELLGNKIYDLNGKRQNHLINLLKALPQENARLPSIENANDFLCSIGFQSDYTKENSSKELLNEQLDFILEDANTSETVNADIVRTLKDYKQDQAQLAEDVSELNIAKLVERSKIVAQMENSRTEMLNEKKLSSDEAAKKYYESERNDLLKMGMDTLRLLKYVINDTKSADRGKLIGFIYAMRKGKEQNLSPNPMRSKPYYRRKRPAHMISHDTAENS